MKRAWLLLVIGVVSILLVALVVRIALTAGWQRAGRLPWPDGLGVLEDFPKQFPKTEPSAAALHMIELARPLGIELTPKTKMRANPAIEAIGGYVHAEQVRNAVAISAPPPDVAAYLGAHEREIDALRDHLLAHAGEVSWAMDVEAGFDAPLLNLVGHMHAARLLTARALVRARENDARAWTDLEAVSRLDETLQKRPELVSQLVSLAIARTVNAASWKMPLPVPPSFASAAPADHHRLLLRAMQSETWIAWHRARETRFANFFERFAVARFAVDRRETAQQLPRVTACNFNGEAFSRSRRAPNTGGAWTRSRRFIAEREAAANALRIRSGQPIDPHSRCSDGTWRYENGTLSFSRELPRVMPNDMPLTLVISRP
jgi:hypothetical protein